MAVMDMDQRVTVHPETYQARVLNLEKGLPTVEEGRRRPLEEVKRTKLNGGAVLKVIHGYGSSRPDRTGGKLREGVRKSLLLRRKEGAIPDLARGNPGITIVLV